MEQQGNKKKLQVTILLDKNEALALPTAVTIEDISYYPNIGELFNFTYALSAKDLNAIYMCLSELGKDKLERFNENRPHNSIPEHIRREFDEYPDKREILLALLLWAAPVSSCKVTEKLFVPGNETDILYYRVAYLDKIVKESSNEYYGKE